MSIGAIGVNMNDQQLYSQPAQQRWQPPTLTNTAQLLGISTGQLSTDLQSGKTLSSLAPSAGASTSDLLSAVESDLQASAPSGAPALSSSQLRQFATNLINGPSSRGHFAGQGHGGPHGTPPALTDTAQLLSISASQLSSDLQSGQTLSSLATSAGVSSSDLLSAVEGDLQAGAPSGASALSSSQLQQLATNLINGGAPGAGGAAGNLGSVAAATGLSSSTLLAQLTSGTDMSQLWNSPGATGYGSTIASELNGGVMFDEYA
jgi:ubiquinone biosynthesis protein UbiJ